MSKLQHYGVRDTALKWFESYLTSRYHFTTINNQQSCFKTITSGILQGSILGPLLYTIYVNDIFFVADTVKCVLYADDIALVVTGKMREDVLRNASKFFTAFSIWFAYNCLALNSSKTNFVIFGAAIIVNISSNTEFNNH